MKNSPLSLFGSYPFFPISNSPLQMNSYKGSHSIHGVQAGEGWGTFPLPSHSNSISKASTGLVGWRGEGCRVFHCCALLPSLSSMGHSGFIPSSHFLLQVIPAKLTVPARISLLVSDQKRVVAEKHFCYSCSQFPPLPGASSMTSMCCTVVHLLMACKRSLNIKELMYFCVLSLKKPRTKASKNVKQTSENYKHNFHFSAL